MKLSIPNAAGEQFVGSSGIPVPVPKMKFAELALALHGIMVALHSIMVSNASGMKAELGDSFGIQDFRRGICSDCGLLSE